MACCALRVFSQGRKARTGREATGEAAVDDGIHSDLAGHIEEICCHRDLLVKLLTPICNGRLDDLRQSEQRHIRRLLDEIGRLVDEVTTHATSLKQSRDCLSGDGSSLIHRALRGFIVGSEWCSPPEQPDRKLRDQLGME